jgi:hypothetical protein
LSGIIAKIIAAAICIISLVFGLIRLGVGLALMVQVAGIIDAAVFHEPVSDIQRFLGEKNDQAYIPLTALTYLAIIAFMGFCLVLGAVGAWRRRGWGYGFLALYLLTHASLFVNFQTVNQKINTLIAGIVLYIVLILASRYRRD